MRDIVIVGAGPVGATLALALRDADRDVVLLDARAPGSTARGDRSLALSHGARLIFERLGIWTRLSSLAGAITPIVAIDVSQADGFGAVVMTAEELVLPALGYVVSYAALQGVLDAALAEQRIELRFGVAASSIQSSPERAIVEVVSHETLEARLAVVADGAAAGVRGVERQRHDYGQVAIVATVTLDHPHGGVAYERFTPDGPIALLPQRQQYGLVWTQAPAQAEQTLALSETAFIAALSAHFGSRVRGFVAAEERRSFPLTLEVARNTTTGRVAVIGNAAQALHPIAGQGFNLGLRDAFELARIVIDTPAAEIGSRRMLARYAARRSLDRRAGIALTHGLVRLFGTDMPLLRVPRGIGMLLLDTLPLAKRTFTRAMLFGLR
jgi:2-octaprenyl-6-methoxyphenol hydroxylase